MHIGELWDGAAGMDDTSIEDRDDVLLDLCAKDDVVEVGLWRVADGRIAEAWYFGDDLGLVRQLGAELPGDR